jgi:RHS repeat-associated protein
MCLRCHSARASSRALLLNQRIKQVATLLPSQAGNATTATLTTWYLPGFEKETNSATSTIEYKYYLSAGGRSLGVFVDHATVAAPMTPTTWPSTANGAAVTLAAGADWRYFHQDNLGSVVAITNATGAVMEQLSYDAFGKRRNADGSDAAVVAASPYGLLPPVNGEDRGYTGHEMLDSIGLVHMNGRIYDPVLGRFLSADPFITSPGLTQNYNRYSYVYNNPLVLTDPSGYDVWSRIGSAITNHDAQIRHERHRSATFRAGETIAAIVAAYYTAGASTEFFSAFEVAEVVIPYVATYTGATILGGITGGLVGGFIASGGDFNAAAQGALAGGLFAFAGTVGGPGGAESGGRYAAHGFAGCVSGAADGSGCGRGAAAAVTGKFITNSVPNSWGEPGRFAATVVAGGTASRITGGKFGNGALTAAYGYILNHLFSKAEIAREARSKRGHHPFAVQWLDDAQIKPLISDEAALVAVDRTMGDFIKWEKGNPNRYANETGHPEYNKGSGRSMVMDYLSDPRNGISSQTPMTAKQMHELIGKLQTHPFNISVQNYVNQQVEAGNVIMGRAMRRGKWYGSE